MSDLVDIALPTNAQKAAEALGLRVQRNISSGAWVRRIPRDEAEIAVECLRDWGIVARIVDVPRDEPPSDPGARRAAQRHCFKLQIKVCHEREKETRVVRLPAMADSRRRQLCR